MKFLLVIILIKVFLYAEFKPGIILKNKNITIIMHSLNDTGLVTWGEDRTKKIGDSIYLEFDGKHTVTVLNNNKKYYYTLNKGNMLTLYKTKPREDISEMQRRNLKNVDKIFMYERKGTCSQIIYIKKGIAKRYHKGGYKICKKGADQMFKSKVFRDMNIL